MSTLAPLLTNGFHHCVSSLHEQSQQYRQPLFTPEEYSTSLRHFSSSSLTNYYLNVSGGRSKSASEFNAASKSSSNNNGHAAPTPRAGNKRLSSAKQWLLSNGNKSSSESHGNSNNNNNNNNKLDRGALLLNKSSASSSSSPLSRQKANGFRHSDLNLKQTCSSGSTGSSSAGSGGRAALDEEEAAECDVGRFATVTDALRSLKDDLKFSNPR
jgi:hypothetical protein